MTTEYNRGYQDCIRAARIVIDSCISKKEPVRPNELMEAIYNAMTDGVNQQYTAGVATCIARIKEELGPLFLPLYPGDLYELRECLNTMSP
jgi:hypothetical protein